MEVTTTTIETEQAKGYWTEGSSGYLDIAVSVTYSDSNVVVKTPNVATDASDVTIDNNIETSAIVLSSNYWYRVQHFKLTDDSAWSWIKTLLRECGRKLPTDCLSTSTTNAFIYRVGNLSLQQVNQMYYLLKHALTSAKVPFQIEHTLLMVSPNMITIPAPKPKKNRRARRNKNAKPLNAADDVWQVVGVNKL